MGGFAIVILAAGQSRRFGDDDKLLADLQGKPLAQAVIDCCAHLNPDHKIAVLDSESAVRRILFERQGFAVVENTDPGRGQHISVKIGVQKACALGADTVMIMLADMPFVSAAHCAALLKGTADMSVSEYDGQVMPPMVFRRDALASIAQLGRGKPLLDKFKVKRVGFAAHMATDVDTQSELDKFKS